MLFDKVTKLLWLSVFLLVVATQISLSQDYGIMKGKITDQVTGDPLPGANVVILNTSLGASSDFDGNYTLPHVPAGKRTIRVSYIGYEPITVEIEIRPNETLRKDFTLVPQAIMGEEIVVTAQARGQQAAINQQLSANTIKNVVSAEKIRELPDENASAALSRLPGVSIQEGDKIVLRGIQAKQNVVLMNGVQLPSTSMDDRSVNLGFISSNMLSGIEVVKVLTPDMDANAIGGVVNLRLREAPENFHLDVLTQGVYNGQDHTYDNYKFWASASNRFFNNALGVYVQGNLDRTNGGTDQTNATYTIRNDLAPYGSGEYAMTNFSFTDQENIITNGGGSIILDYVLPHGKIVLQNSLSHNVNDAADYRTQLNFSTTEESFSLFRNKYNRELLINSLFTEYNIGKVKTEVSLSHSYSDKNTDIRYGDPGQFFGFTDSRPFGVLGYDGAGNPIRKTIDATYFTPDDVYKIPLDDSAAYRAQLMGWAVTRGEEFKQHLYTAKVDVTFPVAILKVISSEFKVGGKFDRSTRTNDVEGSYHRVGDEDMYNGVRDFISGKTLDSRHPLLLIDIMNKDYERGEYFLDGTYPLKTVIDKERMDVFLPKARDGWRLSRHKANSERNDFDGSEMFTSGYLMGTFKIGPRLTLIGGVRYEQYEMDYNAKFVYVTHSVDGLANLYDTLNNARRVDRQWFPNAQIQYKITSWSDIRLAYTKTISRPDYVSLLPNVYYAPAEESQAGNPNLKPTVSTNYDASLYFYSNTIGLFSITGFYKELKDISYRTQIYYKNLKNYNVWFPDSSVFQSLGIMDLPEPGEKVTVYINDPYKGYLKGLEVEWQTNFWYLPKPLNALVLNVNYTRTWSSMDNLVIENVDSTYKEGPFTRHKYISISKKVNTKILYQGDHTLNIAMGIDYKGFSGRVSYNLQDAVNSYIAIRPEESQYTGRIHKWDLTLNQKLPIQGLSVAFNGVNLFRGAAKSYQDFRRPGMQEAISNLVYTTYSPTFYELVLRYSL